MQSILKKKNKKSGMTTIELVVVFGIFAALATTMLFSYREFSSNIKLKNLSQDIALQIRQAQNKSISGSFPSLSLSTNTLGIAWTPSYGLYFSEGNDYFVLFFDRNTASVSDELSGAKQLSPTDTQNGGCNLGDPNSECLDIIQMTGGERIDKICFDEFTSNTVCSDDINDVHIVFTRPLNNASILETGMLFGDPNTPLVSDVSIYIKSPTDKTSIIRLTSIGQIIVE